MPGTHGAEVLKRIKEQNKDIQVVIISGQEDVGTAIDLLKNGAFDYLVKNDDTKERLWNAILHLRTIAGLKKEVEELRTEVGRRYDFSQIILGKSDAIKKVYGLIEKASRTNIIVSITGETGTGKEVVAKAIHYNSDRHKMPFVAVNVAAIPTELLESELFGHEKGAFTGAVTRRIGKFEEADKGTLFLDEIGELDINLQAKLLRVLQEKEITRVGGNSLTPIYARIIVATHKNLLEEVQNKRFREDLYYRLFGLPVELPPLRDRDSDILILAKHFIDLFCKDNKLPKKSLTTEAQHSLLQYGYPGNVRELKSIMELAVVMSDGDTIDPTHITLNSAGSVTNLLSQEISLKAYTNQILQHYLNKYDSDVLLVAKKLNIGKSTIYRMLQNNELVAR